MTLVQRFALSALAAACLSVTVTAANAGGGAFTRGCAARDMQVLKMIEDREATVAASAETLSVALLTMTHARNVCDESAVMDALGIYDDIVLRITLILSSRKHTTGSVTR